MWKFYENIAGSLRVTLNGKTRRRSYQLPHWFEAHVTHTHYFQYCPPRNKFDKFSHISWGDRIHLPIISITKKRWTLIIDHVWLDNILEETDILWNVQWYRYYCPAIFFFLFWYRHVFHFTNVKTLFSFFPTHLYS